MRTKDLAILILFSVGIFILLVMASGLDQINSEERLQKCKEKHGMAQFDRRGYIQACLIQY